MGWQDGTVIAQGEANAATMPMEVPAWQRGRPVEQESVARPPFELNAVQRHFQQQPKIATTFGEYLDAGWQQSVSGLVKRGRAPDTGLDSETPWYGRAASSVAGLVGDAPAMLAGGLATVLATGGRAPAPLVGAATFAVPAALRAALMDAYTKESVKTASEFVDRTTHVAWEGFKGGVVGAATVGAGMAVKAALPVAAPAAVAAIAPTAAEIATMTTVGRALEGQLPELQDFADAAIVIGGVKGAIHVAPRLKQIYTQTGKTPAEVVADIQADPTIREDLIAPTKTTAEILAEVQARYPDAAAAVNAERTEVRLPAEQPTNLPTPENINNMLVGMRDEVGADEQGGRIIIDETTRSEVPGGGDVLGRTVWTGQRWWFDRPDKLSAAEARATIDKALEGKPLGKRQARFIEYMQDEARFRLKASQIAAEEHPALAADVQSAGMTVTAKNVAETDAVARLAEIDEAALERLAIKYDNDDSGFMAEVNRLVNEHDQNPATAGGRQEGGGEAQSQSAAAAFNAEETRLASAVPRAYEALAAEETARAIVPGTKAEQVAASPFAEIPQAKGEPALPTHVNYDLINTREAVKMTLSRVSEVYEAEIQTQRRGKVTWEQTEAESAKIVNDMLGGTGVLSVARQPGTAAGAAEMLARKQITVGAAESMMAARDELLAKGADATEADKLAFINAIERTSMIASEFLGARAEAGRALQILKNTVSEARQAQQMLDIVAMAGKKKPLSQQTAKFALNKVFTEDKVLAARALLKSKIGTLNSGMDPETLGAGLTIAGAHIEAGVRDFVAFSKAMVADLGDAIKPHLQELFDKSMESIKKKHPEIINKAPDATDVNAALTMYGDPLALAGMMKEIDNPAAALKFAQEATKATTWEKVVEAWKASILSGPVTHVANIMGNGIFMAMRVPIDAVAGTIGLMRSGPDRVTAMEPLARAVGNLQGTMDGFRYAWHVLKTGDQPGKSEQFRKAIDGTTGEVIRTPFRILSAADAIFSTMNERGEAYTLAVRQATAEGINPATREFRERVVEIAQNPGEEMQAAITEAGKRYTFNTPLGKVGQKVQDVVKTPWFGSKVSPLEAVIPFIRTPMNILEELTRMTPLAPLVENWRADVKAGGGKRDKAIAEMSVGTGIAAVVFMRAMEGNISGAGDPDPGKRAVQMAAGWQPYSIKFGNTWYSYQRLQPLGTLMGLAADIANVWDHMSEEEADKIPKIMTVAFANAVTNQTFLQGITNVVHAFDDPARFGPRLAQSYAGSVVPNIIAQPTAMADPVVRQVDSMLDAIKARIPGMRDSLMPKRDVFGEPIKSKERVGGLSPVTATTESDDKVRSEAARIGYSAADTPKKTHIGRGTGKAGDVKLEPDERDIFADKGGHFAYAALQTVVNDPAWDKLPDAVKLKVYRTTFAQAHKYAAYQAIPLEKRIKLSQEITEKVMEQLQPEAVE